MKEELKSCLPAEISLDLEPTRELLQGSTHHEYVPQFYIF